MSPTTTRLMKTPGLSNSWPIITWPIKPWQQLLHLTNEGVTPSSCYIYHSACSTEDRISRKYWGNVSLLLIEVSWSSTKCCTDVATIITRLQSVKLPQQLYLLSNISLCLAQQCTYTLFSYQCHLTFIGLF